MQVIGHLNVVDEIEKRRAQLIRATNQYTTCQASLCISIQKCNPPFELSLTQNNIDFRVQISNPNAENLLGRYYLSCFLFGRYVKLKMCLLFFSTFIESSNEKDKRKPRKGEETL